MDKRLNTDDTKLSCSCLFAKDYLLNMKTLCHFYYCWLTQSSFKYTFCNIGATACVAHKHRHWQVCKIAPLVTWQNYSLKENWRNAYRYLPCLVLPNSTHNHWAALGSREYSDVGSNPTWGSSLHFWERLRYMYVISYAYDIYTGPLFKTWN